MTKDDASSRRSPEAEADELAARVEKEVAAAREAIHEHIEVLRFIEQQMLDSCRAPPEPRRRAS